MNTLFTVRTSDFVLDKVLNPLKDKEYGKYTPDQLDQWCGIIPDFFCKAIIYWKLDQYLSLSFLYCFIAIVTTLFGCIFFKYIEQPLIIRLKEKFL